ncbi:MAG: DUF4349 domain-containing protein [Lachnospiraceae bacterium]|nr:DUF4349 domain-containing protein [Lachnospiraceae bacterium]
MNCEEIMLSISLYLDKELNREEGAEFLAHLDKCEECRKIFEETKLIFEKTNSIPLIDLPNGYEDELFAKLKALKSSATRNISNINKNNKRKFGWKQYSAIAAAVLVLLIGGSVITSMMPRMGSKNSMDTSGSASYGAGGMPKVAYSSEEPAADSDMNDRYLAQTDTGEDYGVTSGEYTEEKMEESSVAQESSSDSMNIAQEEDSLERLKIKRLYVSIQTKEYDAAIEALKNFAQSKGGYVQSYYSNNYSYDYLSNVSLREGNIVLRVPKEYYEESKSVIKEYGEVLNEDENTEDITSDYVDTEGRLRMKKVEEERLLSLLEKSESVDDIIKIEERLSAVRSDIEVYTSSIKNWDRLVEFSTITISITEMNDAKISSVDPDFTTKIKDSFINAVNNFFEDMQNLLLAMVSNSIYIVIFIIVVVILALIARNIYKKHKKNDM